MTGWASASVSNPRAFRQSTRKGPPEAAVERLDERIVLPQLQGICEGACRAAKSSVTLWA